MLQLAARSRALERWVQVSCQTSRYPREYLARIELLDRETGCDDVVHAMRADRSAVFIATCA